MQRATSSIVPSHDRFLAPSLGGLLALAGLLAGCAGSATLAQDTGDVEAGDLSWQSLEDGPLPGDEGSDWISPALLAAHQVTAAFPGAELTGEREVYDLDGQPLGMLLTFRIGEGEPWLEGALFQGEGYYSTLASYDEALPLRLSSTFGRLSRDLDDVDLVYAPWEQAWLYFDADGVLYDALDDSPVDDQDYQDHRVDEVGAALNREARAQASDELMLAAASCGSSYGRALDSYDGITAYSNGSCSGTGSGRYQCVEYIDRVHPVTTSHSGNADSYAVGRNARNMDMILFRNGGSRSPLFGDIVVSDAGTYGHVGILKSVGSSSATVIHQNWSASSATMNVSRSGTSLGGFSSGYPIYGWLRPGWNFNSGNGDSTSGIVGWSVRNASITQAKTKGFQINPGSDPSVTSPSGLNLNPYRTTSGAGNGYGKIKIKMKSSCPDGNVKVYFTTSAYPSWSEAQSESTRITTDGSWRYVTVDMRVNGYWVYGGRVNQIRIDPCNNGNSGSSDIVGIDKVWFAHG